MRVALIEVSHWHARMHLRSFQLAGASIVAVSDHQPAIAHQFADELGCLEFSDYREMLAQMHPDFVMALGRPVEMPAIAQFLLEQGLPFGIEKPVGISAGQIAPLLELARQKGAFVAIPLVRRYSLIWEWLGRLEDSGRLGARSHAHFRIINGPPQRYIDDQVAWMLDPQVAGGGCLRNLGIHAVDAFLQFVQGERVEVVAAALGRQVYHQPVEEFACAILRSESGVIGTIEAGYSYAAMNAGDDEWRLATANGYLIERKGSIKMSTLDDGQTQELGSPDIGGASRYDRFGRDTLERLRQGRPPIADLEACYRAMQVIDQIYAFSAQTEALPRKGGSP